MATKLKIEKRGDEIIPLEIHFFVDSLLLVTQIILQTPSTKKFGQGFPL
jgi:hypothetical protein